MISQLIQNVQHRRDVMHMLLWITSVGGIVFCAINFYRGLWALAILELVYGLFSLSLVRIIKVTPNLQKWILIYIIPFFMIMMFALFQPRASQAIFAWILTIPVIAYLLLGRQKGFWLSLVFIVTGLTVFHWRFMVHDIAWNLAVSLNVILSAFLMMAFAHVYELNREKNEERLLELAGTDRLTGLANRLKLADGFKYLSAYAQRDKSSLTVVLIDLDFFKQVNDRYGHHIGDLALCHIADFLKSNVRNTDLLARFGGEEFALLMGSTGLKNAYQHVEQLRQQLVQAPFILDEISIPITISAGISVYGEDGNDLESLLVKADKRLYLAKGNGRNQVVISDSAI
ncbi:GGDEF domain-containing protein [Alteromonadaceae bacterium BrNp21-10]|nr:GGDEF domain-containing protein [Alteromonadaceae bacterium BrNp21-10]